MSTHKKLNIEASLSRSISQAPGLDFDKLAEMPVIKMTEHDYITRQQPASTKQPGKMTKYFKPISAVVAGCLVMLAGVSTWFAEFKTPDTIIALDTNQSIEIITNKQRQVLSVKAFDEEAQTMLSNEDFNQGNLEDSVSIIIATIIKNGYLDDNKNVIMVSVENGNVKKASDLTAALNQVIIESAAAQNVTPTVVRQFVTPDQDAVNLAEQYNVSVGKLNVMQEIASADSGISMTELAEMSLTDLLAVSKDKAVDLTDVIQVDEPERLTKELGEPEPEIDDDAVKVVPVLPDKIVPEPETEENTSPTELSDSIVEQAPAEVIVVKPDVSTNPEVSVVTPVEDQERTTMELPDKSETEPTLSNQNDEIILELDDKKIE